MTDPDILRGIKAMVALQMATLKLARSRESVQAIGQARRDLLVNNVSAVLIKNTP